MSNPFTSSATRFRIVLIIALFASISVVIAVVAYGVQQLNTYADQVNQQVVAAANSEDSLANIRSEVQQLEDAQDVANRAKQIVAESKQYKYQDTIIRDIERFARRAGVNVQSYDFTSSAAAETATSDSNAAAAPQPGGAAPPPATDLHSTVVTIAVESPVNYRSFLNFLNYIEQNLTKMQVASVRLSAGENASQVSTESMQIEVYVR